VVWKSRVVYRGRLFEVRRDLVSEPRPRGVRARPKPAVREVVAHRGSVVVLPVLPDGRILLVRQYRYAPGEFLWELVAGGIDAGESPLEAARRELKEETGYESGRLEALTSLYPTPGFVAEKMHLFRATSLRRGRARPEADETLTLRAFSLRQLERMLRRGTLRDGKTIIGVLLERARRERRRARG